MPILQAAYRGKSFVSNGIKLLTYSQYSHTAALFEGDMEVETNGERHFIASGSVCEAWKGGVKLSSSLSERHERGTTVDIFALKVPMTPEQEKKVASYLVRHIGVKYNYINVLRFVPIVRLVVPEPLPYSYTRSHVYCTQLFLEAFNEAGVFPLERCKPWEVPPRDPPRSPLFKYLRTEVTI
jgi:uncharacterized protein YycO